MNCVHYHSVQLLCATWLINSAPCSLNNSTTASQQHQHHNANQTTTFPSSSVTLMSSRALSGGDRDGCPLLHRSNWQLQQSRIELVEAYRNVFTEERRTSRLSRTPAIRKEIEVYGPGCIDATPLTNDSDMDDGNLDLEHRTAGIRFTFLRVRHINSSIDLSNHSLTGYFNVSSSTKH